jgi:hypothetical protein
MTLPAKFQTLFATYPTNGNDLKAQIEAYSEAIKGHDIRDIEKAISRFLRGEVDGHNPAFAPTAPQVGAAVRKAMHDRLDLERAQKPYLPPPTLPPPDPESVARVQAMLSKAVAHMTGADLDEKP